jgi:streptomycin 6-kinase
LWLEELLPADAARGALLLERLGRSLHQLALPVGQRHEILCSAATRVWHPAPGRGLPTGAEKGRWLADFITAAWTELDPPC